ncbi:MFS transporter [Clostridium sp. AM58-1XD]|uniref:MFS transporter n=1 Tax=Clostridium sp. AM58-1XD TaxID=2292307 RepID=UPI000E46A22F|nr:MFS transporter [Clostridium sp. AM58-1XD]RGZ01848.1 MFS transporter [Clostridium sp. AM58-1XD]
MYERTAGSQGVRIQEIDAKGIKRSGIGERGGKRRNFCLMVAGQIVSILGSSLLRFALSLYILDITGRADIYAALYAVSNIPMLISPLGGAVADRFNRRNLMVIFDFMSSAFILVYYIFLSGGGMSVPLTGTLMILLSAISAMYMPAVTSSIPLLVDENRLEAANGAVNGVQALSNVAAPVIGGVLYGIVGVKTLVLISGISFFCSAVLELFIHIPFIRREWTDHVVLSIVKDLKAGFMYAVKKPLVMRSVILAALLNMILTPLFVVGAPVILKVAMNSTDAMYGAGMGAINFATILGALLVGIAAKKMEMRTLHSWIAGIAVLILPIALSVSPSAAGSGMYIGYILFLSCSIPIAMAMTAISIFVLTKIQKETPDDYLGKVMAITMAVSQCAAPAGQLVYGFVFEKFRSVLYAPILIICAAMILLSFLAKRMMRHI